jgi:hypothetical protein
VGTLGGLGTSGRFPAGLGSLPGEGTTIVGTSDLGVSEGLGSGVRYALGLGDRGFPG